MTLETNLSRRGFLIVAASSVATLAGCATSSPEGRIAPLPVVVKRPVGPPTSAELEAMYGPLQDGGFLIPATPYQQIDPTFYRQRVIDPTGEAPGTIIVDNSERRLYHVLGSGIAMKYAVSVGRDGFIWTGSETVTRKTEWPTWTPPEDMRAREAKKGKILPVSMKGGLDNPLGSRAIYLGSTIYRIHGTNQPSSLGKAQSSGCIRMANEDVEHLYAQVTTGATVIVRD